MKSQTPDNAYEVKIEHVRLGEFDLGGVLYHANYFHLCEAAREAFLSEHGIPYSSLVENSQHLSIVESHQNFLLPILYGTPLRLYLWCTDLRKTSFKFHYELFSEKTLLHSAWTLMAFVSKTDKAFRPGRLPAKLVETLDRYQVV